MSNSSVTQSPGSGNEVGVRINPAELKALLAGDASVRIIDVRTSGEFESGHIEGAYNVPLETLSEHARELAGVDVPVVLVCQSGFRAAKAETALVSAGKGGIRLLDGGMNAWTAAGGQVRVTKARWSLERQVRLVAGAIVFSSIVASVWVPEARFVAGFIGAGLTFAAVSNTCAMGMMLAKLPYNRGASCDVGAVVTQLRVQPTS